MDIFNLNLNLFDTHRHASSMKKLGQEKTLLIINNRSLLLHSPASEQSLVTILQPDKIPDQIQVS